MNKYRTKNTINHILQIFMCECFPGKRISSFLESLRLPLVVKSKTDRTFEYFIKASLCSSLLRKIKLVKTHGTYIRWYLGNRSARVEWFRYLICNRHLIPSNNVSTKMKSSQYNVRVGCVLVSVSVSLFICRGGGILVN